MSPWEEWDKEVTGRRDPHDQAKHEANHAIAAGIFPLLVLICTIIVLAS